MEESLQLEDEKEPNDTFEIAESMLANRESASQDYHRPGQYVVDGSVSKSDVDWYKVYLSAGKQYVSINRDGRYYDFNFEVYNADKQVIKSGTYSYNFLEAFAFNAPSDGYYYVKMTGTRSEKQKYKLLVGSPTYDYITCYVKLGSISMVHSNTVTVDLRNRTELPDGAIVMSMHTGNVTTQEVRGVSVSNLTKGKNWNLRQYIWDKQDMQALNIPLKSVWQITFKHEYKQNRTLTPSFDLMCAYPVTSKILPVDKSDIYITK